MATGIGAAAAGILVFKRRTAGSPTASRTEQSAQTSTSGHRGGSGSPLVLLHGVGGNWRVWTPVLKRLEAHHDVFAPTMLGHGGAAEFAAGVVPSVDALADGIEAMLDSAGVDRAHIVGNSLGGWVALELARRGRASSVVVFSPAGAWRSQWRIYSRVAGIRMIVAMIALGAPRADAIASQPWMRWLLLSSQVAYPMRVDPELLAADIRAAGNAPGVQPLLRALPLRQLEPLPADRTYPIRVVWGDADRILPYDQFGAPMIELLPGAEVIRQKGVGHIPMSDDPLAVAQRILEVTTAVDEEQFPRATSG